MNKLMLRVEQNPGTITLNFDELNKQMDAKLAEYKGAIFTEETKDIAKAEVASLRKLKEDVDSARIAAKKEWSKPFEVFEKQMKALSAKVDEPINLIDGQLKEFEAKRRTEKKVKIRDAYGELVGDMAEYLPFEKIYDTKWGNATTSMKSIKESIATIVKSTREAVSTIQGMQSDAVGKALSLYKDTLDMAKAISYINDYERQKAEIMKREEEKRRKEEERQRRAEIERARVAEREAIEREERIRKEAEAEAARKSVEVHEALEPEPRAVKDDVPSFSDDELPFEQPITITAFYKVVATAEELEAVEMAFNSIGIYFERRDA